MENKELNIKSSTIEKSLELAKEFLGKLISPAIEEVGLLFADKVKFYRFKNQVKVLLKTKEYVERYNIPVKEIPLKILVPLLENASLEEEEILQEKWAKMLANIADSNTNLQNHVFPYILSQISKEEFDGLETLSKHEVSHIQDKIDFISKHKQKITNVNLHPDKDKINEIEQHGFELFIEGYQIANLHRLGLIRQMPPKIYIEDFMTGGLEEYGETWHRIKAEYEPDYYGYRITELGGMFLNICEITPSNSNL